MWPAWRRRLVWLPSAKGAPGRALLGVSSCRKGRATSLQRLEFQGLGPQPVRGVGGLDPTFAGPTFRTVPRAQAGMW